MFSVGSHNTWAYCNDELRTLSKILKQMKEGKLVIYLRRDYMFLLRTFFFFPVSQRVPQMGDLVEHSFYIKLPF